jgi:hypothetical protein
MSSDNGCHVYEDSLIVEDLCGWRIRQWPDDPQSCISITRMVFRVKGEDDKHPYGGWIEDPDCGGELVVSPKEARRIAVVLNRCVDDMEQQNMGNCRV